MRLVIRPMPVAAIEIWPGFFLARSISSGSVETPSVGLTPMNIGCKAMMPTGRKSWGSLTGIFGATLGIATKVERLGENKVVPSGAASLAARAATLPFAPG